MSIVYPLTKSFILEFLFFRLVTGQRTDALGYSVLYNPDFQRIKENNVDDNETFNSFTDSTSKVLSRPNTALYVMTEFIQSNESLVCQLKAVWTTKYPLWSSSAALPKGSPFTQIMNSAINELRENGGLDLIQQKDLLKSKSCPASTIKNTLSLNKVLSPFLMLLFSIVVSFFIFGGELIKQKGVKENPSKLKNDVQESIEQLNNLLVWHGRSDITDRMKQIFHREIYQKL